MYVVSLIVFLLPSYIQCNVLVFFSIIIAILLNTKIVYQIIDYLLYANVYYRSINKLTVKGTLAGNPVESYKIPLQELEIVSGLLQNHLYSCFAIFILAKG